MKANYFKPRENRLKDFKEKLYFNPNTVEGRFIIDFLLYLNVEQKKVLLNLIPYNYYRKMYLKFTEVLGNTEPCAVEDFNAINLKNIKRVCFWTNSSNSIIVTLYF